MFAVFVELASSDSTTGSWAITQQLPWMDDIVGPIFIMLLFRPDTAVISYLWEPHRCSFRVLVILRI